MAGISMNCKNGDVTAFGDCVGSASKALCGLTEAAGQVMTVETRDIQYGRNLLDRYCLFAAADGSFFFFLPLTGLLSGWCVRSEQSGRASGVGGSHPVRQSQSGDPDGLSESCRPRQ